MDATARLLENFAAEHADYQSALEEIAETSTFSHLDLCSDSDSDSDTPSPLHRAAGTLISQIPGFFSHTLPKTLYPSDAQWRHLLRAAQTFYTWSLARGLIAANDALDRALQALSILPVATLPVLINILGRQHYWDLVEAGDEQGVQKVEERLRGGVEVEERFSEEGEFERVLRGDRVVIWDVEEEAWTLRVVQGVEGGENVEVRLPRRVAAMGVRGVVLDEVKLGLRGEVWRPVCVGVGRFVGKIWPEKDMFEEETAVWDDEEDWD